MTAADDDDDNDDDDDDGDSRRPSDPVSSLDIVRVQSFEAQVAFRDFCDADIIPGTFLSELSTSDSCFMCLICIEFAPYNETDFPGYQTLIYLIGLREEFSSLIKAIRIKIYCGHF